MIDAHFPDGRSPSCTMAHFSSALRFTCSLRLMLPPRRRPLSYTWQVSSFRGEQYTTTRVITYFRNTSVRATCASVAATRLKLRCRLGVSVLPNFVLASGNEECLLGTEAASLTAVRTCSRSLAEGSRKLLEIAFLHTKHPLSSVVPMRCNKLVACNFLLLLS